MKIARVTKECMWAYPWVWSKPIEAGNEFLVLEKNYVQVPEGRVPIDLTGAGGRQESLPLDSVEVIDLPPVIEIAIIVPQGSEGLVVRQKDGKQIGKRLRTVLESAKIRRRIVVREKYTHYGRAPYPKPQWGSSLWVVREGRLQYLVSNYDTTG